MVSDFGVQTHKMEKEKEKEVKLLDLPLEDLDLRRSRGESQRSEKKISTK